MYRCLPPAYTVDADGKPLHSWRTLILPFLEQQALYDKIDLSKPWDDPVNKEAGETKIPTYQCPSTTAPEGHTTYLAVVARGGCFGSVAPRKWSDITDGTSSTLMVIDVDSDHAVRWMSPSDASDELILNLATSKRLSHPGGFQAALADGSTRFLSATLNPATLRALISIAGKDDASLP